MTTQSTNPLQVELENMDDVPDGGVGAAVREYLGKVRGGDVGALPAVLGLVALVFVFTLLRPSTFTNAFNFANLINQGAAVIVIAMGLVFGYAWCRTGRLWPLVIAHGVIDTVAFVGYIALAGHLGWLK